MFILPAENGQSRRGCLSFPKCCCSCNRNMPHHTPKSNSLQSMEPSSRDSNPQALRFMERVPPDSRASFLVCGKKIQSIVYSALGLGFHVLRVINLPPPCFPAPGHLSHFVQKRRSPFCLTYPQPLDNQTSKPTIKMLFLLKGGLKNNVPTHSPCVGFLKLIFQKSKKKNCLVKLKTSGGWPARNILSEKNWKNGFRIGSPSESSP